MDEIMLIEPCIEYGDEIWAFRREIIDYDAENENQFAGCISLDKCETPKEYIRICSLRKKPETCKGVGVSVPSHTYIAIRKSDKRVVGIIDLRHHINHPILGTWGGHCGYSVRPSERKKGYAKKMLQLNLCNARSLGIHRLLVTCCSQNIASEKVIIANGGVLENIILVDGSEMKRYWITI